MRRFGFLIAAVLMATWALAAPAQGDEGAAAPRPTVTSAEASSPPRPGPARPSETKLRSDLHRILARPEYHARTTDWRLQWQLRLLRALEAWWVRHVSPFFASLYSARPMAYWLIMAACLAALFLVLYHIYLSLRSAFGTAGVRRRKDASLPLSPATAAPDALLAEADQAARAGNFALALRSLYLALIRHLDRQSVVRYDLSHTNRDYLRQARGRPDIVEPLAPLTDLVDLLWYGRREPTAADYDRCREWAMIAWQRGRGHEEA